MNYKCLLVFHLPLLKCLPSPGSRQSVSQWVSETNIRLEPPRHLCGIIWVINQLSKCSRIPFGHHDAPELLWRGCAFCLLLFLWRVAVCVCVRVCTWVFKREHFDGVGLQFSTSPLSREGGPKGNTSARWGTACLNLCSQPKLGKHQEELQALSWGLLSFSPSIFVVSLTELLPPRRNLLPNDQQRYLHLTNSPTGPLLQMWYWQLRRRRCGGRQWDREPNFECPKYHIVGGRTRGKMWLLLWT